MKIKVIQRERTTVRLGDLKYGEGFLNSEGSPYIVLNPNRTCFEIQAVYDLKILVLALHRDNGTVVLGHLDAETEVRPVDVKITLTERN